MRIKIENVSKSTREELAEAYVELLGDYYKLLGEAKSSIAEAQKEHPAVVARHRLSVLIRGLEDR